VGALLHEIERDFEAGGLFAHLHRSGIDGGYKEFPIEFVDFSDDVAVFATSPHEGFFYTLLAEIVQIAILAHLLVR
jgi:hypothetical protein